MMMQELISTMRLGPARKIERRTVEEMTVWSLEQFSFE